MSNIKRNMEKIKKCGNCGYAFEEITDSEDYKSIEETGECLGCFETE